MTRPISTRSEVEIFHQDQDISAGMITVENHWNRRTLVLIKIKDDDFFEVRADELIRAINNAQNAHSY